MPARPAKNAVTVDLAPIGETRRFEIDLDQVVAEIEDILEESRDIDVEFELGDVEFNVVSAVREVTK